MSLTSMAERTLGSAGARLAGATYLFLHYALLVACALAFKGTCTVYLWSLIGCSVPPALPPAHDLEVLALEELKVASLPPKPARTPCVM